MLCQSISILQAPELKPIEKKRASCGFFHGLGLILYSRSRRKKRALAVTARLRTYVPLISEREFVTVVQVTGVARLPVCFKTKPEGKLVQRRVNWLFGSALISTEGGLITGVQAENSEVLPAKSVAVAVINRPVGTVTGSFTEKFVVHENGRLTIVSPR